MIDLYTVMSSKATRPGAICTTTKLVTMAMTVLFTLLVTVYLTATPSGDISQGGLETTPPIERTGHDTFTTSKMGTNHNILTTFEAEFQQNFKSPDNISVTFKKFITIKDQRTKDHTHSQSIPDSEAKGKSAAVIQSERSAIFLKRCHGEAIAVSNRKTSLAMHMLYLTKYRLAMKLIPKIGSTFMSQMFRILISRPSEDSLEIFNISRSVVHHVRYRPYSRVFNSETIAEVTPVIFARNPFSRIFSAYIDKVFILNSYFLSVSVYKFARQKENTNAKCVLDLTFKDFVTYVLHKRNALLRDHYMPTSKMISLSVLCSAKDLVIVKQETFASDIELILQKAHVNTKKQGIIKEALRSRRVETTITSIVKTAFTKNRMMTKRPIRCVTWLKLIKRLWDSFIIQGHLHEECAFPIDKFRSLEEQSDQARFLRIILKAARENPITPEQRRYQRKKALVAAFADVERSDVELLYAKYKLDFLLFDYDEKVPTM